MQEVKVNTKVLLSKVRENLETHMKDYHDAKKNYRKVCLWELKKREKALTVMIEKAAPDPTRLDDMSFGHLRTPSIPQNYKEEYEQVIEMLAMSINQETVLTHAEFKQYVMDNWPWKNSYSMTCSGMAIQADSISANYIDSGSIG